MPSYRSISSEEDLIFALLQNGGSISANEMVILRILMSKGALLFCHPEFQHWARLLVVRHGYEFYIRFVLKLVTSSTESRLTFKTDHIAIYKKGKFVSGDDVITCNADILDPYDKTIDATAVERYIDQEAERLIVSSMQL